MNFKFNLLILLLLIYGSLLFADPVLITSGTKKNQFIELYTSEGCSSCPPADKWLSQLKNNPNLWNDIIPIAFHVDYWDQLGWKDKLANQGFSQRQRRYRSEGGLSQVYTPGLVVDGQEWKGFFTRQKLDKSSAIEVGELTAEINGKDIIVEFMPRFETSDTLLFHVAVLGFNISSKIDAGENGGKTLFHDFAVIGYSFTELQIDEDKYHLEMELPKYQFEANQKAVALWVSELNSQPPLQVAGNWL